MSDISVVMIVKNEEKVISNTLQAIINNGFKDIVVVDTGSVDKTKLIAYEYTSKVYDFKWNNDFSSARNFSINKALNDYVLIIDADEVLQDIDINELNRIVMKNANKIGRIEIINKYTRNGNQFQYSEYVSRLFNKKIFKYEGKIHEQIVEINNDIKPELYSVPIKVNHLGYSDDEIIRKGKIERNIKLLKDMMRDNKDDAYIIYQLGKTYFMKGDYTKTIEYFNKALDFDLDTRLEYVQDMVETYGYALLKCKQYEKALELTGIYDEFSNSCDFVFMIANVYMNNGYYNEAIEEFNKAKKYKACKMEGINEYLANYNIGVIYECLGNIEEAISYYTKSKNYIKCEERLKNIYEVREKL